jgi:hypothetical protein
MSALQVLASALERLLDDMGETGLSVSPGAKAQARIAIDPFLAETDGIMPLVDAERIVADMHSIEVSGREMRANTDSGQLRAFIAAKIAAATAPGHPIRPLHPKIGRQLLVLDGVTVCAGVDRTTGWPSPHRTTLACTRQTMEQLWDILNDLQIAAYDDGPRADDRKNLDQ